MRLARSLHQGLYKYLIFIQTLVFIFRCLGATTPYAKTRDPGDKKFIL